MTSQPQSARCPLLRATYLALPSELGPQEARPGFAILVMREAEEMVSVAPPGASVPLPPVRPGDGVLLELDAACVGALVGGDVPPGLREARFALDPFLSRIGHALRCGFRMRRPPTPQYLASLAQPIAEHLAWWSEPGAVGGPRGLDGARLERVRALVQARLGQEIYVEDLAAAAGLSPFHFTRAFKRANGQSPHAYVTGARIAEAQRRLRETDEPLQAIAVAVGYRTQAHFTGVFRRHVGTTPHAFRKQWRKSRAGDGP